MERPDEPVAAASTRPATARARRRRSAVAAVALLALVAASRIAVLPVSPWEQDEAYLAAAVVEIDLDHARPHAPFFPLFVGAGKLVHALGVPPARSLQLVAATCGTVLLLPLVALWSRLLDRELAVAAAVLSIAVPGVWLLSARALSGPTATALLVAALAVWSRDAPTVRDLAVGSATAGLAVLVRPQTVVAVVAVAVVLLLRHGARRLAAVAAPGVALVGIGVGWFTVAAGGPGDVLGAIASHAGRHFGGLHAAQRGLLESGPVAVIGHPAAAVAWCVLAAVGITVSIRSDAGRGAAVLVAAALTAHAAVVFGLSDPTHPRYAVPLVVLSGGFVVAGAARLFAVRWVLVAVAAAVCAAAALVLPAAAEVRRRPSPPVRALDRASDLVRDRSGEVVVDRTLHAFVQYRQAVRAEPGRVVFDHVLESGLLPPPDPATTVMVFDDGHDRLLVGAAGRERFQAEHELLRQLGRGRFVDVTVADGAVLEAPK